MLIRRKGSALDGWRKRGPKRGGGPHPGPSLGPLLRSEVMTTGCAPRKLS